MEKPAISRDMQLLIDGLILLLAAGMIAAIRKIRVNGSNAFAPVREVRNNDCHPVGFRPRRESDHAANGEDMYRLQELSHVRATRMKTT